MAKKTGTVSSINIDKLDNGCVVRIECKYPDKNGYEGYSRKTKSYTADDDLLDQILKYVDAELDEEVEESLEKEGVRKINPKSFLTKSVG